MEPFSGIIFDASLAIFKNELVILTVFKAFREDTIVRFNPLASRNPVERHDDIVKCPNFAG